MSSGVTFGHAVVLVIHAHPDDEVFATGAATIAARSAGASVHLRLFTGGEVTSDGDLDAARSRKERRLEKSVGLLGIDDWAYLTEPGRWVDTPDDLPRTIAAARVEDLVPPVVEALESLVPDIVLTVGDDGLTGHPDHVACHAAVREGIAASGRRPVLLGAVLDEQAVRRAYKAAESTLGHPVGSGRVKGKVIDESIITVTGPPGTAHRRRRALDAYIPGLGTSPLAALDQAGGDGTLLRFVMDIAGWEADRFAPVPRGRG